MLLEISRTLLAKAWPMYTLPRVVSHLRLLVLVALETTHLTSVDFVHVHICVHHQLILADAGGGKGREKEKSQTGSHKVQLEPSYALLDLLQFKNKCNLHPFAPLETLGIRQTMQKAQIKRKHQLQWEHQNPAKPSTKELNPSHPHPEQKSRAGFKLAPGQAQSKTDPLTDLFHMCPLKPGRGGSAQKVDSSSGLMAQPPVRGGQSLWHPVEPAPIPTWTLLL